MVYQFIQENNSEFGLRWLFRHFNLCTNACGTITYWLQQYRKECKSNLTKQEESRAYAEINCLKKELEELKKENDFLKKAAAFFAKEIDLHNTNLAFDGY